LPWDELKRMKQNQEKNGFKFWIDFNATSNSSAGSDICLGENRVSMGLKNDIHLFNLLKLLSRLYCEASFRIVID